MTDMDKMMIEPCPFCGETELRVSFSHEAGQWDIWEVECEACCVSKDGELGFVGDAARQSAIAAWNHRAYNPDDRLREALRCAEERFHMAANAIISPDTLRRWSRDCNDALNNRPALSPLPQGDG